MAKSPASIPFDTTGTELATATNPVRVDPTGTTAQPITDNGGSLTVDGSVSVSNLPAVQPVSDNGGSLTVDGTVAATQSGAWNITNVSGTVSLPTGAATETTLASINTKTLAAGQALMAASSPVVIASDQTVIPVSDNGGSLTVDGSVSISNFPGTQPISAVALPLPSGAATAALQTQPGIDIGDVTVNNAAGAAAVNVQDGGNSLTVDGTIAATQSGTWNITNVSGTVSLPTGAATAALQTQPGVDIGDVTINNAAGASAVNVQDGGNSLTVDGTVTANQGSAAALSGAWPVKITDGTNTMPTMDSIARAGFQKLTDGTTVVDVNAAGQLWVTEDNSSALPLELATDTNVAVTNVSLNMWFKALTYTCPANYKFVASLITTGASVITTNLRVAKTQLLATFNTGTLTGTANLSSYTAPQFASGLEAEVTTLTANTANTVLTITYTNQDGVTGKTATLTVAKQVPAGWKMPITLAAGDYGVRAVTAISGVTANVGQLSINGVVTLVYNGTGVAGQVFYNVPQPGTMILRAGETINLEYITTAAATAQRIVRIFGRLEAA